MALISCPECERRVSSSAPNCPQCGHPISAAYAPRPAAAPAPAPSDSGGGSSGWAVLLLVLLIGGGIYYFTQTEAGKQLASDVSPVREGPATIKLARKDQLLNAAHRHTVWINGQKAGLISNGATNSFDFTAKSNKKTEIYIEAYDPFVENPKSNKLSLDVNPGDEVVASVAWRQNGTAWDLFLEATVKRK